VFYRVGEATRVRAYTRAAQLGEHRREGIGGTTKRGREGGRVQQKLGL
jgi:hypothetical protein